MEGLVLKVADYLRHAAECRAVAKQTNIPEHKAQLEEMAKA